MPDEPATESTDIRWQLLASSRDMMDTTQGNGRFPFAFRSSLAIFGAVPPEEELDLCDRRTIYLKVTATLTGYQPSSEETEEGYVQFPDVPTEDMDQIMREYFACYGVFLQVAVFPRQADEGIARYPRIVDFEPKRRDLYQAATETGEILSASKSGVKTDRSFTHSEDTETGLDVSTSAKFPMGKAAEGQVGGKLSHKWGETDKDTWQVTADASRERRETQGMKTELSQMYNLLTGYHAGTNRATFLMLPRPHVLQPTDHRTFIQGLREIEGTQDFFLVVEYPADLEGMCVDLSLDTGHFPEHVEIEEPEEVFDEMAEDFWVEAYGDNGFNGNRESFERVVTAPAGWLVDRGKGDTGHPGCRELENDSNGQANGSLRDYVYGALNDTSISVSGSVKGADWWGPGAVFRRKYRAYFRSEEPQPSADEPFVATPFLVTNRRLGTCIVQGAGCFAEVPPETGYWHDNGDWVVQETSLEVPAALLTATARQTSRTPALKAALQQLGNSLSRSGRLRTRYPYDTVGFLSSGYFLNRVLPYLDTDYTTMPIGELKGVPENVKAALGAETTVAQVIGMDAEFLAKRLGGDLEEALGLRKSLAMEFRKS